MITNQEDNVRATKLSFQNRTFTIETADGEDHVIPYSGGQGAHLPGSLLRLLGYWG